MDKILVSTDMGHHGTHFLSGLVEESPNYVFTTKFGLPKKFEVPELRKCVLAKSGFHDPSQVPCGCEGTSSSSRADIPSNQKRLRRAGET